MIGSVVFVVVDNGDADEYVDSSEQGQAEVEARTRRVIVGDDVDNDDDNNHFIILPRLDSIV